MCGAANDSPVLKHRTEDRNGLYRAPHRHGLDRLADHVQPLVLERGHGVPALAQDPILGRREPRRVRVRRPHPLAPRPHHRARARGRLDAQ